MKNVIDIHGQNDNQSILDVTTHIELLDNFSSNTDALILKIKENPKDNPQNNQYIS